MIAWQALDVVLQRFGHPVDGRRGLGDLEGTDPADPPIEVTGGDRARRAGYLAELEAHGARHQQHQHQSETRPCPVCRRAAPPPATGWRLRRLSSGRPPRLLRPPIASENTLRMASPAPVHPTAERGPGRWWRAASVAGAWRQSWLDGGALPLGDVESRSAASGDLGRIVGGQRRQVLQARFERSLGVGQLRTNASSPVSR